MSVAVERPVRERVLDAATAITTESGWGHVTMAKVATLAGVSRQTVYNEYGAKPALGQAMVLRELDRFLAVVAHELDTQTDLVDAIRAAALGAFAMAQGQPAAALGAGVGAQRDRGQRTRLRQRPAAVPDHRRRAVDRRGEGRDHGAAGPLPRAATLTPTSVDGSVDAIVRLVLSHVMQPGPDPQRTSDHLAWIARQVLRQ